MVGRVIAAFALALAQLDLGVARVLAAARLILAVAGQLGKEGLQGQLGKQQCHGVLAVRI